MNIVKTAAAAILAAFSTGVATAQTPNPIDAALARLEGTTSVSYSPTFSNGQLVGCGIEFNAVARDWTFRKGEYDKVAGSFGLMISNRVIAPILKVVVHELDRRDFSLKPAPPKKAYVTQGTQSNFSALISRYNSDTPGALFSIFKVEPTIQMYAEALALGKLSVRYGKSASGLDIPLVLDLHVIETRDDGQRIKSQRPVDEMLSCITQLVEAAR